MRRKTFREEVALHNPTMMDGPVNVTDQSHGLNTQAVGIEGTIPGKINRDVPPQRLHQVFSSVDIG